MSAVLQGMMSSPVPMQHEEVAAICCTMQCFHDNLDLPECDQTVAASHTRTHV